MQAASNLIGRFETYIINPALLILFAAGFLLFVAGLVEFMFTLNAGGERSEGKQHMLWGVLGMLIMVSVYGIIAILNNTFDLQIGNPDVSRAQNITTGANLFGQ
jgi:uncharacterized membrane protein YjfL (UPF0719 family)